MTEFSNRHIGPSAVDQTLMLKSLGLDSLTQLVDQTVPKNIRLNRDLDLPQPLGEQETLEVAAEFAQLNKVYKSYIGTGYYNTHTPSVILRNILENPGWYTAYTPYQAEIAQGRLEALLNFQTMISDMTALPIANSSLLDEGTAAAEAMALCFHQSKTAKKFFVSSDCHPQTIEVLETRAEPLEIEIVTGSISKWQPTPEFFGVLVQYPNTRGQIFDFSNFAATCHDKEILVVAATDLLALTLIQAPGEWGADIAVGSSQRFGVPMGYGGPHAGFMATKEDFKRSIPGRIVGVSVDMQNRPALRLALQTREQHIRREKATSNICTAQVLLAVMASMYAVYHGPKRLTEIATRCAKWTAALAQGLKQIGYALSTQDLFDTLEIPVSAELQKMLKQLSQAMQINLRHEKDSVMVSFDETTSTADFETLLKIFKLARELPSHTQWDQKTATQKVNEAKLPFSIESLVSGVKPMIAESLQRKSKFLTHPVFNTYHSETEMMRYVQRLQSRDLSLIHSMIPLGSCTMKLNASTEMIPITWPNFANLHPFAPIEQAQGYMKMIHELEHMLAELTGFSGVSLQPNAGSQGEYAGLIAIRKYHQSRGQAHRKICLIPSSAHGTNPASAVMAGLKVVVVACDSQGNVDVADLRKRAEEHRNDLAALMITYPSTHGVFEEAISEICKIVHENGGQVYMDGANFNALVGLARPGDFGPDVCHLNLHKTFCIPHGGGGPGVGPTACKEHLRAFLPGHRMCLEVGKSNGVKAVELGNASAVSSAPFGSAAILLISWSYIRMMGLAGLQKATEIAILNANYMAERLKNHYPILYVGKNGRVAHECIVDLRGLKQSAGVEVEDVAKRLIDYGFHSPTMSWPVIGTLMIEPTESESKAELDRFCDAMISIREEVRAIEQGKMDRENNPLKKAPHTMFEVTANNWDRPYSREQAAFPLAWIRERKFWPAVGRVNNPHGDRNLVCTCPPLDSY